MNRELAAHISDDGRIQTIKDHLEKTAETAKAFAGCFGAGEDAYLCGLIHDIGKYSEAFQKRIYKESKKRVDHSGAGAVELKKRFGSRGRILAYCVAGHHTGLPDGGTSSDTEDEPTLCGRLQRELEPYNQFQYDIEIPSLIKPELNFADAGVFTYPFYIRMLYSCLVDADFLDTETFMQGEVRKPVYEDLDALSIKMDTKIAELNKKTAAALHNPAPSQNDILNIKRGEILQCCIDGAEAKRGLFTLTVPTGGGKTLSSLAFALKHAVKHGMQRIIYVIPYNSIIEQNAKVFEDVMGTRNVLQHHSGIDYNDSEGNIFAYKRLATENWDMPIVVTTAVQFFESLFANKSSSCRKLHNITDSVIIFDEAQLLPIQYLKPCTMAIAELVTNYGCTVVLCSATQPALSRFLGRLEIRELYGQAREAFFAFKRAAIRFIGELDDDTLAQRINEERQVLCVVSTRKQAQAVFARIKEEGTYHLSTFMVPVHRQAVLAEIRQRLKDKKPCRVISTSLIEAGVDVDFPVVYRAEAGLDSLIQAAGRCNREGKQPEICPVYVFKPETKYRLPAMLERPIGVMRSIANQFDDATSFEAIEAYFNELYDVQGDGVDSKNIVKRFEKGRGSMNFPFASVAKDFKLIDENTRPVVIPYDEKAKGMIEKLKAGERTRELLRGIQPYTVNVYPQNFKMLKNGGWLDLLDDELDEKRDEGLAVLTNMEKYSDKTGLDAFSDDMRFIYV